MMESERVHLLLGRPHHILASQQLSNIYIYALGLSTNNDNEIANPISTDTRLIPAVFLFSQLFRFESLKKKNR